MPTPSVNITLVSGAETVTLPGPPGGTDTPSMPRFVSDQSANGTRWTYQTTSAKRWYWSINLMDLTYAQKTALQTFFDDTVRGPVTAFTYTHTDGNSHTVRFTDTMLNFGRVNGTSWSVSFRLELTTEPL